MASSFREIARELKEQIRRDYLLGMEAVEIAKKYGFADRRTVYYHLKPLSRKDKLTHMDKKLRAEEEVKGEVVNG